MVPARRIIQRRHIELPESNWIEFHKIISKKPNCEPQRVSINREKDINFSFFFEALSPDGEYLINLDNIEGRLGAAKGTASLLRSYHPGIEFNVNSSRDNPEYFNEIVSIYRASTKEEILSVKDYLSHDKRPKDILEKNGLIEFIYL